MDRTSASERFERAVAAIDAANADDPNRIEFQGESHPKELLHARRATHWVRTLDPAASEALLLAVRAHHLRRWQLPRSDYPEGRAGYHAWRRELQQRHAQEAGQILAAEGYGPDEIERVKALICKRGLGREPEVGRLEDALCLVFLESQLGDFASRHGEERAVDILVKSLRKMSPEGRRAVDSVDLPESLHAIVARAAATLDSD
jgi:hypothetical protein